MVLIYDTTQNIKNRAIKKLKQIDERKDQRGMTLLEIIIVLGIIGTIAAGVVILAQRAFDSRAISEIVSNTNTVRIAVKDAYQRSGSYTLPVPTETLAYTAESIRTPPTGGAPDAARPIIGVLVQMGKLSVDEARNGISNDYFNIGGGNTGGQPIAAVPGVSPAGEKGFFIELNGLNESQCRSIVSQVGNQWDYVEVVDTGAGAGNYTKAASVPMAAALTDTILRSLHTDGNVLITPNKVTAVCSDTTTNAVVLGSR